MEETPAVPIKTEEEGPVKPTEEGEEDGYFNLIITENVNQNSEMRARNRRKLTVSFLSFDLSMQSLL